MTSAGKRHFERPPFSAVLRDFICERVAKYASNEAGYFDVIASLSIPLGPGSPK